MLMLMPPQAAGFQWRLDYGTRTLSIYLLNRQHRLLYPAVLEKVMPRSTVLSEGGAA